MKIDRNPTEIVDRLTEYFSTYVIREDLYSDITIVNDLLYGIGVSLNDSYQYANGFSDFKNDLTEFLSSKIKLKPTDIIEVFTSDSSAKMRLLVTMVANNCIRGRVIGMWNNVSKTWDHRIGTEAQWQLTDNYTVLNANEAYN